MNRFELNVMPAAAGRVLRRMSLAEIMAAVTIVAGSALVLGRSAGTFTEDFSVAERRVMAAELAAERIHATQVAGAHADTMATLESTIPGYPGFARVTAVRRLRGDASDSARYRVVTTTVLASGLAAPVRKMALIRVE